MSEQFTELRIGDLVLYKNNQLIAFNKPSGLGVQPDKTDSKSLLDLAEIYSHSKLNVVHRLDRPASGVVLFAKTRTSLVSINEQFRERRVAKTYLAVVQNRPEKDEDTLVHFITKDGRKNLSSVKDADLPQGQKAELSYTYRGSIDRYHLLEVQLITGRHHQIRAQLAAIGCPIKGDTKYGFARSNRDRSIHLHAWKLAFDHPVSGERVTIQAPLPPDPVWNAFLEADPSLNPAAE